MDKQETANQSEQPAQPPKPPRLYWAVKYVKNNFEQRRTEKQKQSPADRAAKSTARATWAIAFLTIATIGVGISQYIIFDRQLKVMQGQLDLMLRDDEPHFAITDKIVAPSFQNASAAGDVGFIVWNIPYVNSGKGTAVNVSVNTYMSLNHGAFVKKQFGT